MQTHTSEVDGVQITMVDLPEELFPMTVEFYDGTNQEVKKTVIIDGPGVLPVPSYEELGVAQGDVHVRISYPDGEMVDTGRGVGNG